MFFLIWIGFCAVPAIIASNKGRSAAGWFFGSILLTPLLGAIIVACLPAIRQTQEQRILATREMRKCPHCAELVKAEAKICRYCQRDLPAAEVVKASEGWQGVGAKTFAVTERPKVCALCGFAVLDARGPSLVQCQQCGTKYEFS